MIAEKNYQPHERKLIAQLQELHSISPEDASMIISINRRKSKGKPFLTTKKLCWHRFGPTPIFVQNGKYHHHLYLVDENKPYWVILYEMETPIGMPAFSVSNKLA